MNCSSRLKRLSYPDQASSEALAYWTQQSPECVRTHEQIQADTTLFSRKLAGSDLYGIDVAFPDELNIDEKAMAVDIVFGDGNRRDGVGDLLEISGIDTERHKKNPICLFDHGKAVQLPIALTEDPSGQYTVRLDVANRRAVARAYFYQGGNKQYGARGVTVLPSGEERSFPQNLDEHAVFCEQLFDLVAKKFIRAGSIGYQVIKSYPLPPDPQLGSNRGQHLLETLMLEASIVVLPANGDTVRKALALPSVCGKPLSPYLVKSLTPYAEPKKVQVGYEPKTKDARDMEKESKSILTENSAKILKVLRATDHPYGVNIGDMVVETGVAAEDLRDAVEELLRSGEIRRNYHQWKITYQLAGDASKALRLQYRTKSGANMANQSPQKPPAEEAPQEPTKREMPEEPFGAQTIRQMHADHKLLLEDYDRMLKLNDHPAVKKALDKFMKDADKNMSAWEQIWNSEYKDLEPLAGAMHGSDVDPEQGSEEADSAEEELPPPEEAAEAERESAEKGPKKVKALEPENTKSVTPPPKRGKNPKQTTAHCGQYERCYNPNEGRRHTHTKGVCAECGKEDCGCQTKGLGVESGHTPGMERNDPEPGTEYQGEPNEYSHVPGQLQDHEKEMVGNAHHFLKELSVAPEMQNTQRMDAWHHSKTLANISLAEAHEKVAHNLGNQDVPPATWEPGVGAKSQPPESTAKGEKDFQPMEQMDQMENVQAGPETEQVEDHRKMCGKAAHFLQEIATGKDWSDTHREKSAYWHKALGGMMGHHEEAAQADAAMHEMGSMKELKSFFDQQNQELDSLNKKLVLLGVN